MLLEQRRKSNVDQGLFLELFLAMQFTLQKLQDPAFVFRLESEEDTDVIQMLLKPIVSQLVIDPPALLDDSMNIPCMKEVDDLLVVCIGQMAVTAGFDLLWKPLNLEVKFILLCYFLFVLCG